MTYYEEPDTAFTIPETFDIKSLHLSTYSRYDSYYELYKIELEAWNTPDILTIVPRDMSLRHHKKEKVDLQAGERIVAVRVDVRAMYMPEKMAFLIYDFI